MDGWRCLAYIENGTCKLISRKQNQFKSFGRLTAALAKLKVQNAIIDAEVVCLDAKGKSVFLDLKRPRKANAILYCFDLLWLNNEDLRNLPLVECKPGLRHIRPDVSHPAGLCCSLGRRLVCPVLSRSHPLKVISNKTVGNKSQKDKRERPLLESNHNIKHPLVRQIIAPFVFFIAG
jgi:ATP dependent DNA ligase domain